MLILIPGATGYLGSCLVQAALTRGHSVRALGRDSSKFKADLRPRLEGFVQIQDFDDKTALDAGCKGVDAIIVGYNGDPTLALDGQLALIRAAERAGIKRFHAMSWNLDWEHMQSGSLDSLDPFIAFRRQVQQTSSIKPVFVFSGVLAKTLFGVPGAGALEGDSAVWIRGDSGERTLRVIGKGETKTPWSLETDVASFSVALVTSPEAEKGGFYRFTSDEFTLQQLAATYTELRGAKCEIDHIMNLETSKKTLASLKAAAEESGEIHARWRSYLGLAYAILVEEGTYNFEPVDAARFPGVKRTSLRDFVKETDWI